MKALLKWAIALLLAGALIALSKLNHDVEPLKTISLLIPTVILFVAFAWVIKFGCQIVFAVDQVIVNSRLFKILVSVIECISGLLLICTPFAVFFLLAPMGNSLYALLERLFLGVVAFCITKFIIEVIDDISTERASREREIKPFVPDDQDMEA